jgi:hypothetical protein
MSDEDVEKEQTKMKLDGLKIDVEEGNIFNQDDILKNI